MSKSRKAKLRIDRVIICVLILLLLVGGLVMLIRHLKGDDDEGKNSSVSNTEDTVNAEDYTDTDTYIRIEQDDCSLMVGSSLQLTLLAAPEDLASSATYSTTNESVVTVDANGLVKVVGEGTGAIVCVAGTHSDSIIIDGISATDADDVTDAEDAGQDLDDAKTTANDSTSGTSQNGEDAGQDSSRDMNDGSKDSQDSGDGSLEDADAENPTAAIVTPSDPDGGASDAKTTQPASEQQEETTIDAYATLNAAAVDCGFTPYTDGTYVYREDGNYLGEAIIGENMTQIYVKIRTSGFDASLKNLLSTVLPTGYATAFSKMTTATSTITMTLDGRKVRVIVSSEAEESHRQMIIYY